jgi:cyclopropane-fatty-acyl-phospholipid synthase
MNHPTSISTDSDLSSRRDLARPDGGLCRTAVLARLKNLANGEVTLLERDERVTFGVATEEFPVSVTVRVHDASIYRDIALGGDIAAAEGYIAEKWTVNDLTGLIRIFAANPEVLNQIEHGVGRVLNPLLRLNHFLRRNRKSQSRKNIQAHYDLGDDLFSLFLDPTMSYSSAVYPRSDSSLDEAALHKLDLVCQKLELTESDHLLEIGTGWGGLAVHAAGNYGCRVTTTTISDNQYERAIERAREAGLSDRITVLKHDYRDLTGHYDKLVSIEMIEAVGHEYMDTYLKLCSQRLKPNGRALFQAILMNDRNFEKYRSSVDFIQKYIFPGGALPSLKSIMDSVHTVTDFKLAGVQDITQDYARTLRDWRERFLAKLNEVRLLGYPEEFIRMWEYYLCYCEGGFTERAINTVQIVLDKPHCELATRHL